MRVEKLTNQLQQAFAEAQSIAIGNDHSAIEFLHLLLALLNQQGGSVRPILNRAGFDVNGLQEALNLELDKLAQIKAPTGEVNIAQELGRLMNLADRVAQQNNDQYISSETLLQVLLEDSGQTGKILSKFGDAKKAIAVIASVRGGDSCLLYTSDAADE